MRFLLDDLSLETEASLSARTVSALVRLALLCFLRIRDGDSIRREMQRLRDAFLAARSAPDTGAALIAVLTIF